MDVDAFLAHDAPANRQQHHSSSEETTAHNHTHCTKHTTLTKPTRIAFRATLLPTYCLGSLYLLAQVYLAKLQNEDFFHSNRTDTRDKLVQQPSMAMFIAWMPGALLWTYAADKKGRKLPFLTTAYGALIFTALKVAATNLEQLVLLQGIVGFFISGQGAISYVLTYEWSPRKDNSLIIFLANVGFAFGNLLLVGIAALGEVCQLSWRIQQLILCAALLIPLLAGHSSVMESPRFLSSAGRLDEAEKVLRKALARAKREPPPVDCKLILEEAKEDTTARSGQDILDESDLINTTTESTWWWNKRRSQRSSRRPKRGKKSGLLHGRMLFRLVIVCCTWVTVNLLYYGLSFSVGHCDAAMGCNVYQYGAIIAIGDIPGYTLFYFASNSPSFGR